MSVVKTNDSLVGTVDIYSNCKTALWTIENLLLTMIPSRFRHANILKLILIHCKDEAAMRMYTHVRAHQDDIKDYDDLSRPSQLNCKMDAIAKQSIWDWEQYGKQNVKRKLPLEALTIQVGKDKVTSHAGNLVHFWAHQWLAWLHFSSKNILYPREFDTVDWVSVHAALQTVPCLFQIWACKQVMGIAGTFKFRSKYDHDVDA